MQQHLHISRKRYCDFVVYACDTKGKASLVIRDIFCQTMHTGMKPFLNYLFLAVVRCSQNYWQVVHKEETPRLITFARSRSRWRMLYSTEKT